MNVCIFVLDVEEFAPLVHCAREMPTTEVSGPCQGYLRIASSSHIEFSRKQLGFKPAVWYGALTGGLVGHIVEFSRDTLRIEAN
jgi:hypothetical protein